MRDDESDEEVGAATMNAIDRKREEHHTRIRELGSRIRFQGLDEEGAGPEHDALAETLWSEHAGPDIELGLKIAMALHGLADPACTACSGKGAVQEVRCACGGKVVDGTFVHADPCESGVEVAYDPCDCARRAERRRREALPPVKVVTTKAEDLNRRIAEAEKALAALVAKQNEAVAPVVREIQGLHEETETYRRSRADREARVQDAVDEVSLSRANAEDSRRHLRQAEDRLVEAAAEHLQRVEDLRAFDDEHGALASRVTSLVEKRDRVARHHEPKIEKARKTLRRLTFLRGDKVSEDVRVSFGEGGV